MQTRDDIDQAVSESAVAPIERSVIAELPIDEAFKLFTDGIGTWWPTSTHSIAADAFEGGVTVDSVVFEERVGGRVLERMSDGTEAPWGTIIAWDPPHRFVMTWSPSLLDRPSTEVEVRFTGVDGQRTRVELVHRGWENLIERREQMRASYGSGEGWTYVIGCYVKAAGSATR